MCKNWRERGSCKYGDKCLFAHGEKELTKRSTAPPTEDQTPKSTLEQKSESNTTAINADNEKKDPKEEEKESRKIEINEKIPESKVEGKIENKEKDDSFETPYKLKGKREQSLFGTNQDITEKSTQLATSSATPHRSTTLAQKIEDDEAYRQENTKLLMMINGDLNDLLDREIQKVALPSKKIVMGGGSTQPSSSKSPLEAYTDQIEMRGAMPSNQNSSHSQRSSFDDTFNTFTFNEIKCRREESSSCAEEEANLIGEGLFNQIDKPEEHLSSEEETLAHEAASEIKNLLTTKSNELQLLSSEKQQSRCLPSLEYDSEDLETNSKEVAL